MTWGLNLLAVRLNCLTNGIQRALNLNNTSYFVSVVTLQTSQRLASTPEPAPQTVTGGWWCSGRGRQTPPRREPASSPATWTRGTGRPSGQTKYKVSCLQFHSGGRLLVRLRGDKGAPASTWTPTPRGSHQRSSLRNTRSTRSAKSSDPCPKFDIITLNQIFHIATDE